MAPLPNTHNLENTTDLLKKLEKAPVLPHFTLASLDISNLYTNNPVKETKEIIANNLDNNNIEPQVKHELLNWYDTITNQNYFSNNGKIHIQKEGLAMGALTSGIIAEFFLQHLKDTHLIHLSKKHNIAAYFHYDDDILLIYDSDHTDTNNITNDFNKIHPNMKFTAETESDNRINFLDITLHRTPTNWVISIHRVPTFTDTIIPYTSNHLAQHKYASIRFLYNRLSTYHLQDDEYIEEEDTIHGILSNNGFPAHTHKPPTLRQHTSTLVKETSTTTHKWASFTYIGKETTFVTNLFKKTDLKVAWCTNNTIQRLLMSQHQPPDKYARSGVYNMPRLQQSVCRTNWSQFRNEV